MTDEHIDDPVLLAVHAARPAASAAEDSGSSPEAQATLERILSSRPPADDRRLRRSVRRRGEWAVPAIAALVALGVAIIALVGLRHDHRLPVNPATSGSREALSPSQYVFAVGGDTSPRTSPQQRHSGLVLYRAEQVLRARCMQRRGFHYVPDPSPSVDPLPSATGYPSTFYPQPVAGTYPEARLLALRQREGFGIHAGHREQGHDLDPDDRYLNTLPPRRQKQWRWAFGGRNGCYGTAEVQLFGSRRAANLEGSVPNLIYNHLNTVAYNPDGSIARSNTRTAAAATAWSRCMQAATGQRWADENALVTALDTQPRRREIALAVSDTRCAYSTGQAQTFAAAFRRSADHLPVRLETDLHYLLVHRRGWIRRANEILAAAR